MSTNIEHQGSGIVQIIRTPEELVRAVRHMGFNLDTFLETCGVKYNTFQSWKRIGRIPNKSALILFNHLREFSSMYVDVQNAKDRCTNV